MIVTPGGGKGGFKDYLENGQKKGRDFHRDELDQRIPLDGDLAVFEIATSSQPGDGQKYDHLTLSFVENNIPDELLQRAVEEFKEHVLSAWPREDRHRVAFYAEAHRPKILHYTNRETGEEVSRFTHVHIGIGRHDLLTGKAIEPLGFLGTDRRGNVSPNMKYIDAWQESFNARYGLASPKDNPKITPSNAVDTLARYTGTRPDELGNFNQRKAALEVALQKAIIENNVTTWAKFEKLLGGHGTVSKINKDRHNECFRVTPFDGGRAMRLSGVFFQRQFIEKPTDEKLKIIQEKARVAYLEQMQPRKASAYVDAVLAEWHQIKAREHRYVHTGSPFYRDEYKPADNARKIELLDQLERKEHGRVTSTQPPARHNYRRELDAAARGGLQGMPIRNLDAIQRRTEMLLQHNPRVDVRADAPGQGYRLGLRPAAEGSDATGGAGRRIEGQPSNIVDRLIVELRERYEQANDKTKYTEIRQNIDCNLLLSTLSHSQGLDPRLYQVTQGKDGSPRIQCGSRALTPNDFLTKELGMPWKEAAPILRQTYEIQLGMQTVEPRSRRGAAHALWKSYQAERNAERAAHVDHMARHYADAKGRRRQLSAQLRTERAAALAGLKGTARQAAASLNAFNAAKARAALNEQIAAECHALKQTAPVPHATAWPLYLAEQAKAGNPQAGRELARLDATPRAIDTVVIVGVLTDAERRRSREQQIAEHTKTLSATLRNITADLNKQTGIITYKSAGKGVFNDTGQRIELLDLSSDKMLAAALAVAQSKFGNTLTVYGSPEVQCRLVKIAVKENMAVTFADPALETLRQQLTIAQGTRPPLRTKQPSAREKWAEARQSLIARQATAPAVDLPSPEPTTVEIPPVPEKTQEERQKAPSVEEWLAAHPEHKVRRDAAVPAEGRVLYIAEDGRWLQDLGRTVAIRQPATIDVHVGGMVRVDRHGVTTEIRQTIDRGRTK